MRRAEHAGILKGYAPRRAVGLAAVCGLSLFAAGCDAFNPAFVSVVTGGTGSATIPNAPGHVVVAFVNNTEFDERLLDFVTPGLNLTDAQIRLLKPRVRLRVRITFTDGTFLTVEMISGSKSFIQSGFDANAFPDLNQNDLTNVVVNCDVASVTLEPGTNVEVFVPVQLVGYEIQQTTGEGGQIITQPTISRTDAPQFKALQVDDVDEDGNVVLRRNVGTRDLATPATNVLCGSVIAIKMTGSLSVPFLDGVSDAPSYDVNNEPQVAGIGGRYSFRTSIQ